VVMIQVSDEGKKWKDIECGRTYDANTDQQTKVTPPSIRRVRTAERWEFPSHEPAVYRSRSSLTCPSRRATSGSSPRPTTTGCRCAPRSCSASAPASRTRWSTTSMTPVCCPRPRARGKPPHISSPPSSRYPPCSSVFGNSSVILFLDHQPGYSLGRGHLRRQDGLSVRGRARPGGRAEPLHHRPVLHHLREGIAGLNRKQHHSVLGRVRHCAASLSWHGD
jgi:hypothetical protein